MKRMDGQSMIEKIEMERKERREKREREREEKRRRRGKEKKRREAEWGPSQGTGGSDWRMVRVGQYRVQSRHRVRRGCRVWVVFMRSVASMACSWTLRRAWRADGRNASAVLVRCGAGVVLVRVLGWLAAAGSMESCGCLFQVAPAWCMVEILLEYY